MKPICLTIGGSDPTSGAGIQADIRTMDLCGAHPFSAITAITYQTATNFYGFKSLSDELEKQLEALLETYPIKNVKIGMIPDSKALEIIVKFIKKYDLFAVLDPVTISSAGKRLSSEGLEQRIEHDLFPHVKILTPNLAEALFYANKEYTDSRINLDKLKEFSLVILNKMFKEKDKLNEEKAIIIKSAEMEELDIIDLMLINKKQDNNFQRIYKTYKKEKIPLSGNVHGTGCVFSSAITAFLSKKNSIERAIDLAEDFFDLHFKNIIELPDKGKLIDLTLSEEKLNVISQIKEIYDLISKNRKFSKLIPEVRMNISGSLPNAKNKNEVAGIEGRITKINGFSKALGQIKFGVSDHTARLLLTAKEFDNSINYVINLKYNTDLIKLVQEQTNLELHEIKREAQPDDIKKNDLLTMKWLIKESVRKKGRIPDIIWDKGSVGKEPMIRLFGKNSKEMINKLTKIINFIEEE